MSVFGHRISLKVIAVMVVIMVIGAWLPVMTRTPAREIVLIARDMSFYLESDPATPNPSIEVKAGERVRVVLRNMDRGMTHDFALPAIGAGLDRIDWNETGDVTFDVPQARGTYEYICRPHQVMMRGSIIVR
jgi:plastocyanin